jgi:hypothetical protein
LAFKFGRFIDIDEDTKNLNRCDVARVRILTGERRLVDAVMAVKMLGQRYDIRVVEENGGALEGRGDGGQRWRAMEAVSSKASSDGGNSAVAVVEGYSESGSDGDVSETCQVLLEVEKGKRGGKELVTRIGGGSTMIRLCQIILQPLWDLMGIWGEFWSMLMLTSGKTLA